MKEQESIPLRSGLLDDSDGPSTVEEYFATFQSVLRRLPYDDIDALRAELLAAYYDGRTVFLFGNGGSAATASHMMCDLGKGTAQPNGAKRFRVLALTDNVPTITAWSNDASYADVFAEQLSNFVRSRDVVLAMSGSGNSPNVLKGLQQARRLDAITLGLTGFAGGKMKELCDVCVVVPSNNMQVIEDMHHALAHSLAISLRHAISCATAAATSNHGIASKGDF